MLHPWYLPAGWDKAAKTRYNITKGTPEYDYFVQATYSSYQNRFAVGSFAGFAVLGAFGLVVILATLRNALLLLGSKGSFAGNNRIVKAFRRHISQAPLFRRHHAEVYPILGKFLTIHAPLRGQTVLLFGLFLANFLPLVAFYTPFTAHRNVLFPKGVHSQITRYLADRAGVLAIAQLPPLFLLAGRNNPVSLLTGCSFATSMLYHRWFARIFTAVVFVHAVAYSVYEVQVGPGMTKYLQLWEDVYLRMGVVAFICMTFLCFFSLRYFRQKSYEWFVLTHVLLAIIVIIGVFYHIKLLDVVGRFDDFTNYVYASIFFYVFDKVVRVGRVLYLNGIYHKDGGLASSTGIVTPLSSDKNILSISVCLQGPAARRWIKDPSSTFVGSSVQLWIPRIQPLSSHPFTVANMTVDKEGKLCMQLYVRVLDGVTKRLQRRVTEANGECKLSMLVEGFYGRRHESPSNRGQILVAGGIGITHCLPFLKQAIQEDRNAHLVWLIRDPRVITVASDVLRTITASSKMSESKEGLARQSLSIHITGNSPPPSISSSSSESQNKDEKPDESVGDVDVLENENENEELRRQGPKADKDDLYDQVKTACPRLSVEIHSLHCRPELIKTVQEIASEMSTSGTQQAGPQTELHCCGPAGLTDALREIAREINLDFYEEDFAW